jgi:phage virion morphogenesis protein
MRVELDLDDAALQAYLRRLTLAAEDMSPAMRDIAFLGEQGIKEAFQTETAPDGTRWPDSWRKRENGGKTLTKDGNLRRSASSDTDSHTAIWGVNAIYAEIHQFGGKITAKGGGMLKFKAPDGNDIYVKSVTIPPRPYLPASLEQMDTETIFEILTRHLTA